MRYFVLAAVLLLAGCVDFRAIPPTEPPPPPREPALFRANFSYVDGAEGGPRVPSAGNWVLVDAALTPGRDAGGEIRRVHDETLRISGAAFVPTWMQDDGTRHYEGWIPLPDDPPAGLLLRIEPPRVGSGSELPPVLHQPLPMRVGGDTLVMEASADLRLPVRDDWPSPPPAVLNQSWHLEIGRGAAAVRISGTGRLPDPLVVPTTLVPGPFNDGFPVQLVVNSQVALGDRTGDGYFIQSLLRASLAWTVRRVENDPGG